MEYLHYRLSLDEPNLEEQSSYVDERQLGDVSGRQKTSLVVETFERRHIMTTAVERNGRMRR